MLSEVDVLERQFPWIKWRTPVSIDGRFACRICLARLGVAGLSRSNLTTTLRQAENHFVREHVLRRSASVGAG